AVERAGRSAFDDGTPLFVCEHGYLHAWANSAHASASREELFSQPVVKLRARLPGMSVDAVVAALAPRVGDGVALSFSTPRGLVEMAPAGVTTAPGLVWVAAELGVGPSDVIAFGDMPTDIPMLDWAGHGVAMANAPPAVLAAADEVTASNAADGVALVLERWF